MLFDKLAELARVPCPTPKAWLWDFGGVEVASASFIRESFLSVRALLRAQRSNLVPVVVNANADVLEDMTLVLKAAQAAILTCSEDETEALSRFELIGDHDASLQTTFELVAQRGEADARELKELTDAQMGGASVLQTAWNNRLAKLVEIGALVEIPRGRTKRYRPIII
jgi:hypothetical protein